MATLKPIPSKSKPRSKPKAPVKSKPAADGRLSATSQSPLGKPKQKLIRDSFTIPKNEYLVLDELKQRAIRAGRSAKKSEVLRAGIRVLSGMSDTALVEALGAIPSLKTGRPKDAKPAAGKGVSKKRATAK